MESGSQVRKRIVVLALGIALALVLLGVLYLVLRPSPRVSWEPVAKLQAYVLASASGKYIGLLSPSDIGDEGRLLVYRVVGGKVSGDPVFDSRTLNKMAWEFAWAGDALIYVATDGISSARDAERVYLSRQDYGGDDLDEVALRRARDHASCFQRDLGTGTETVVFTVDGDRGNRATPEIGDTANGYIAVRHYDPQTRSDGSSGSIAFLRLSDGRVLGVAHPGHGEIVCTNPYADGVVMVRRSTPDDSADNKYILETVSTAGEITTLARVSVDERLADAAGYDLYGAYPSFGCVHTADGPNVAYFRTPSGPGDAIEVRLIPLDGKKERKLTIRRSDMPKGSERLIPIAVLPDGRGVLVEFGGHRLYYCTFRGRCVLVPIQMSHLGVARVFGPMGRHGVVMEVHRRTTPESSIFGRDAIVGIVSVR